VAIVGDLDGDGRADVAVGATGFDGGGMNTGRVQVLSGAGGTALRTRLGGVGDELGDPVAALGDVDGDGAPDVLAAARLAAAGAGRVYAFSGATRTVLYSWQGSAPGVQFGAIAAGAGDVDGDGTPDVLAGALWMGGPSGGAAAVLSGATGLVLYGLPAVSGLGGAGDVDGDGKDDFLVGHAAPPGGAMVTGHFDLHSGSTGSVLTTWNGSAASAGFGWSAAGVGDVDGDGIGEVIVGANGQPTTSGIPKGLARLYSGATGEWIHSWSGSAGSQFGRGVAGCGDVDGDGVLDVVVGAPGSLQPSGQPAGSVTVFSANDGSLVRAWTGSPGEGFGYSVAGTGDVDADGVPDLAVGVPYVGGSYSAGAVKVFSGSTGAEIRTVSGAGGGFGSALANAGDVDLDGTDDLVVGAPYYSPFPGLYFGQARVISGTDGGVVYSWNGSMAGGGFGWALAGGGDVDGDGRVEIVVGAPYASAAGQYSGQVHVFSGATGAELFVLNPLASSESFGTSVACNGDVNGDGWADVLVGVPGGGGSGNGYAGSGQVRVLAGPSGTLLETIDAPTQGPGSVGAFGRAVAYVGRIDPGACSDLVVGAPYYGLSGNGTAFLFASGFGGVQGYVDLGGAVAGTNGLEPFLKGVGTLGPGQTEVVSAHRVARSLPGVLVLGNTAVASPLLGGTLFPSPDVVLMGFDANTAGDASTSIPLPASVLPYATTLYAQAGFLDPGAPLGVSMTNGLSITFP
jgi:hypothetical protein